jgi:hypothetical protein
LNDSPCPIDLRVLAAEHGYRHGWDPSYDPFNVPQDKRDLWYVRVPGRYGFLWPAHPSEGLLGVFCSARKNVPGRLAALPGVRLDTDGDDGTSWTFPVALFPQVAELIQCHKQRRCPLSAEQLAKLGQQGRENLARLRERSTTQSTSEVAPAGQQDTDGPGPA